MFTKFKSFMIILLLLILSVGLIILGEYFVTDEEFKIDIQGVDESQATVTFAADSYHLEDNDTLYTLSNRTDVEVMYLTVGSGNSSEQTNHTWKEVNNYSVYDYEKMGVERYKVNAILQIGNEKGPVVGELGYGATAPNATVQVRGQTSSRNVQKNYKIELKKGKGYWNGQRTINLNKHQGESLRFRNSLAYTLLEDIPQLISLRTQFVHLYVKDMASEQPDKFVDYGLYTQVEQLNSTGLRAHNLDSEANLYKVNYFEFNDYDNVIKLESDPDYNLKAFEEKLEVKGSADHQKLIDLIDRVNDATQDFDAILEQYLDIENLSYWMAFHILIGNHDTQSRNMYLYSPKNSERWYIISWDNDGALARTEQDIKKIAGTAEWETGISNYWGNLLFQRALKTESFRKALDDAIEDLRKNYITDSRVASLAKTYAGIVEPYISEVPDSTYLGVSMKEYAEILKSLPSEIEINYQSYKDSLDKPMPFFTGVPSVEGDKMKLTWDAAYDFDQEDITYTVEIANNLEFSSPVFKKEGVSVASVTFDKLGVGQYFIRVIAQNSSGNRQSAFDYYHSDRNKISGVKAFHVHSNGTVSEDTYEE